MVKGKKQVRAKKLKQVYRQRGEKRETTLLGLLTLCFTLYNFFPCSFFSNIGVCTVHNITRLRLLHLEVHTYNSHFTIFDVALLENLGCCFCWID